MISFGNISILNILDNSVFSSWNTYWVMSKSAWNNCWLNKVFVKMGRPWEKSFFKLVKLRRKVTTRLDLVNWRVLSEILKAFYSLALTFLLKIFDPCGHKFLLQMYSAGSNLANYYFDIWTHFYFCCIKISELVILASHFPLFTVSLQKIVIIIK